jgi:hypothetical protein
MYRKKTQNVTKASGLCRLTLPLSQCGKTPQCRRQTPVEPTFDVDLSRSVLVAPPHAPLSFSACRTQTFIVSGMQPIFGAIAATAADWVDDSSQ